LYSFLPTLIAIHALVNFLGDAAVNMPAENIEIVLRELLKLDKKELVNENLNEIAIIYKCFPEFEPKYREVRGDSQANVVGDNSLFSGPQSQQHMYRVLLDNFLAYLNEYDDRVIENFINLANIFTGTKVSINSFLFMDNNPPLTINRSISYCLPVEEGLIMVIVSGLKSLNTRKKNIDEFKERIVQLLSTKSLSEGLFKAFLYCDSFETTKLDDIFE